LVSGDNLEADILNYREVSEFYSRKPPEPRFDLVPGVLPGWDNTARYNKQAHVVHGATPRLFEDWLLASLKKAMGNKPENRFVIVNAWNEWAEGAHLEPDDRFGYAFLNSVARAKSRAPRTSQGNYQGRLV
jgi:lipopolysaccharide biosynthesis protein